MRSVRLLMQEYSHFVALLYRRKPKSHVDVNKMWLREFPSPRIAAPGKIGQNYASITFSFAPVSLEWDATDAQHERAADYDYLYTIRKPAKLLVYPFLERVAQEIAYG